MKPRCKSFDCKTEAEKQAHELALQVDRFAATPDTRTLERTTLSELLERYKIEASPTKYNFKQTKYGAREKNA